LCRFPPFLRAERMGWWWKKREPVEAVLYTRQGCHLCGEAKAHLMAEGVRVREVDVDDNPSLLALHGEWVPVVEINGKVRFRGRVNRVLLRRLLRT
jgi:glutaredoxin